MLPSYFEITILSIRGHTLNRIFSFLFNCTQCVVCGRCTSDCIDLNYESKQFVQLATHIDSVFKPGTHFGRCAWFLKIAFVREFGMRVCVCPPPGLLKTIHVK